MPIQLDYADKFGRDNQQAYMRISAGSWTIGSTGFEITCQVFVNKAAADAGDAPVHEFSQFVPYDSSGMTSGIEQYIMSCPEWASKSPVQVA